VTTAEDLAGNDRIYRLESGGIVDMGAYEVTGSQMATFYVNKTNPTPAYPYATVASAATNIQDAVDQTRDGDTVQIYPGHYLATPITVDTDILIRGLTDANSGQRPLIDGRRAEHGLHINSLSCQIENLVITNATGGHGGGAYCSTCGPIFNHCSFVHNSAWAGGGLYAGTATNCLFENNMATMYGGATYSTRAHNCDFFNNRSDYAGGATAYSSTTDCLLTNNISKSNGGGAYLGETTQCVFRANSAGWYGGGTYSANATSCLMVENRAGWGGGIYKGIIQNCTAIENVATNSGGGIYSSNLIINCIAYYNTAPSKSDLVGDTNQIVSCCSPDAEGLPACTTNAPAFLDRSQGNYRLSFYSPCIDAGSTGSSIRTQKDLEGNPRVVNNTADIGAYEFQYLSTDDSDGDGMADDWEMKYWNGNANPTDDQDGDAYDNLHEYIAGTIPTNATSLLSITMIVGSDLEISWDPAHSDRSYWLEWTDSLTNSTWSRSSYPSHDTNPHFIDTDWTNHPNRFYRIAVEKDL
jgi:hypothetical protein